MNKVFVVTAGEYDDYHIVGAFSQLESAKDFISERSFTSPTILEWPLDNPNVDPKTIPVWWHNRPDEELVRHVFSF